MSTNNDNDTRQLLQEAVLEIKKYVDDSLRTNFEDFKQYTDATVSQQTSELRSDIQEMRGDINRLDKKIDDLSDAVAEAIDTSNDETQTQLDNHETRILKLEQNAA
jgi:uncharacterized protein YydD (DUF2326 family)